MLADRLPHLSPKEDGDEEIGNTAGPTNESVAPRRDTTWSLRPAKGIVHYLELVHELLNSADYVPPVRAAA
jgi:hypothetical protein